MVFVVDDDPSIRRGLSRLFASARLDVETFASARTFLARARHDGPACLVVDQRMPELSGLELQESLRGEGEPLSVIFLTGHGDVATSVEAMKGGAFDFFAKPVDGEQLLSAVRAALEKSAAAVSVRRGRDLFLARLALLTPREREVAGLVAEGLLNKQIAFELGTSEKTVKVHRARAMRKLEVGSVAELARLAERTGAFRKETPGQDRPSFALGSP